MSCSGRFTKRKVGPVNGKADLPGILAALRDGDSILVVSHENPDGDAVGSMLALGLLLQAMGKRVVCACDGPVPRVHQWLAGAGGVLGPESAMPPCDTVVIVDVARMDRLGRLKDRLPSGTRRIVIDHHIEDDPCGDLNFIDRSYAAAGEIVTELFVLAEIPLTREAAECLYVAQTTDTGGFRFSNTNARSHRLAALLLDAGADASGISQRVFDEMPRAKFALLRRVIERSRFAEGGRVAHSYLTRQDFIDAGADDEDADMLINFLRNVAGVEAAFLFREIPGGNTKISCRSCGGFDAAAFLRGFGGGGHAAAAGATVSDSLEETCSAVLAAASRALGGEK